MLALPKGDDELNVVYSPFTLSNDYRKKIEPAGKFFEEFVKKYLVPASLDDFLNADAEDMIIDEEDTEVYDWEKAYYESIRGESTALSKVKENYYALLGIDDLFLNATVDDIRKAYKKIALIYHPDKNKANIDFGEKKDKEQPEEDKIAELENKTSTTSTVVEEEAQPGVSKEDMALFADNKTEEELQVAEDKVKDEINKKWLKIKDAYDTLLDPEKRKKYDSTFEFDDSIPKVEDVTEDTFYTNYGPCFIKNALWSKRKPVPKLGDMNTPIDKLKRFYNFWSNFDSWRDYAIDGEHNVDGKKILIMIRGFM